MRPAGNTNILTVPLDPDDNAGSRLRPPSAVSRFIFVIFLMVVAAHRVFATEHELRIAITTTTENSGLMSVLLNGFSAQTQIATRVIVAGSGRALRMLADGDVDVAITHAKTQELELVQAGLGVNRQEFMYNDFILVGPETDPANVAQSPNIEHAFKAISTTHSNFLSRGDESGTHDRELTIWHRSQTAPQGSWYRETGQGMGATLQIAAELGAYTLIDRGTWLAYQGNTALKVLYDRSPILKNIYSVISASHVVHSFVNHRLARELTRWLLSPRGHQAVSEFRLRGRQVFFPVTAH